MPSSPRSVVKTLKLSDLSISSIDCAVAPSSSITSMRMPSFFPDLAMLARAKKACFEATSLRELPPPLVGQAFDQAGARYCVRPQYRRGIDFIHEDLRSETPAGWFDVILCRYVAFTYFAPSLQREVLARIVERLLATGYLAIGTHERLPGEMSSLAPLRAAPQILQKGANDRTGCSGPDSAGA